MKKIFVSVLSALLIIVLAACGTDGNVNSSENESAAESTQSTVSQEASENISAEASSEPESSSAETVSEDEQSGNETSDNGVESRPDEPSGQILTAEFAEKGKIYGEEEYLIYDDTNNDSEPLIIKTTETVTNFKYFKLEVTEHWGNDTDGPLYKIKEIVYTLDEFTPEKPLAADCYFLDVLPAYGISFVDGNGETHYYSIDCSLMDGSLQFGETEQIAEE